MNTIIRLENGLRISFENIPHVRSVCFGVFIGAGCRFETAENNGISHLIEHMCFKGTKKRTAFDIVSQSERLGANLNAYTGKEQTVYYVQCISEYAEECCEILSDIVLHHTFPEDELAREKEVVIEEINMCEDTPDDLCSDLAAAAFWGDAPLGRAILGTAQVVCSITREMLYAYEAEHYVAENAVVSITGNISQADAVKLVCKYFDFPSGSASVAPDCSVATVPFTLESIKPIEQANIMLVYPGCGSDSPSLQAYSVLSSILGGNMSSVLFQRLREQLGLAYSVYSYLSNYKGCGALSIYIGTSPSKVKTALKEINAIVAEYMQHGFSEEEFKRGIMQVKCAYLMGLDSPLSLMRVYGRATICDDKPFDTDRIVKEVEGLTLNDINDAFAKCFSVKPAVGYVGEKRDFDLSALFDNVASGK